MTLADDLITHSNLLLAYQNAARGKRGRAATARFEYLLADHLLELQTELRQQIYLQ
jgi:hypothetical protein